MAGGGGWSRGWSIRVIGYQQLPGLPWPGRLDTPDPSRDNFHQKSSAADHLTTAAREQRGRNLIRSFMSSGGILQLSLWFLSSILADSVFSFL